jgi:hypothetical protein
MSASRHTRKRAVGRAVAVSVVLASAVTAALLAGHYERDTRVATIQTSTARTATSVNQTSQPALGRIIPPTREPAGWSVSYPVRLPAGYAPPTAIAADPQDGGVWAFADGRVSGEPEETLFHWSVSGVETRYPIRVSSALLAGMSTPILVGDSGWVWIGINTTLVSVNARTGTEKFISMPPVTVGAEGSGLPQGPGADPGANVSIDSLAWASPMTIVVGREFATELQTIDLSTRTVGVIRLPADTALAGLGSGDLAGVEGGRQLAAALYTSSARHEVGDYFDGSWRIIHAPCSTYAVSAWGRQLAISGPHCVATETVTDSRAGGQLPTLSRLAVSGLTELPCVAVSRTR